MKRLLALALVSFILGCGGGGGPTAALFPVKGRVTLNGAALTGCTVVLIPVDAIPGGDDGYTGTLNDKGNFELSSMRGKAGAAAGKYKVTFQVANQNPNSEAARQEEMKRMMSGGGQPPPPKEPPYPKEYGDFKTSPKTVEITREANELLIAL